MLLYACRHIHVIIRLVQLAIVNSLILPFSYTTLLSTIIDIQSIVNAWRHYSRFIALFSTITDIQTIVNERGHFSSFINLAIIANDIQTIIYNHAHFSSFMFLSSELIDMQAIVCINVLYCSSLMPLFFTTIVIKTLASKRVFLPAS